MHNAYLQVDIERMSALLHCFVVAIVSMEPAQPNSRGKSPAGRAECVNKEQNVSFCANLHVCMCVYSVQKKFHAKLKE